MQVLSARKMEIFKRAHEALDVNLPCQSAGTRFLPREKVLV